MEELQLEEIKEVKKPDAITIDSLKDHPEVGVFLATVTVRVDGKEYTQEIMVPTDREHLLLKVREYAESYKAELTTPVSQDEILLNEVRDLVGSEIQL